jgi:uncharacterized ion transporter superfamily protein YfcC
MEKKAGAQIGKKAFVQSVVILLLLMVVAGLLTRVVPAGSHSRVVVAGRETIDPGSYSVVARPAYPIWRWRSSFS